MKNNYDEAPHAPTIDELKDMYPDKVMPEPEIDQAVYHPDHYRAGGIETIDYIEAKLDARPFLRPSQAYNMGTAEKYWSRAGLKDPSKFEQDVRKAIFHMLRAIGEDPR